LPLFCFLWIVHKNANGAISAAAVDPRMLRMELNIDHTCIVACFVMVLENLDGHDERILEQIVKHHSVEDLNAQIIGA
jgi:hypothetical protein